MTFVAAVLIMLRNLGHVSVRVVNDAENHCASTVGALMLREVVTAGELLATVGALEGLLVSVEGTVVALEMLLAAKAARADVANEGLGGIFC